MSPGHTLVAYRNVLHDILIERAVVRLIATSPLSGARSKLYSKEDLKREKKCYENRNFITSFIAF